MPGSEGLRERAKREAMSRIRESARTLFAERSFRDVTTREIADMAGVGEATLFRYVPNKNALLGLVYADRVDELLDRIEADDRRHASAGRRSGAACVDRVLKAFRTRVGLYLENPENTTLYVRQSFDPLNPDVRRGIAQGDRMIALVSRIVAEGQQATALSDVVTADDVGLNCHGVYIHELDRSAVRNLSPSTMRRRLDARLRTQLVPLVIDEFLPRRART
jgi:AcrR family transcriptional regulator